MVDQIQKETRQVVQTMEGVIDKVRDGNELVARAGGALTSIIANSEKVLDRIRQVAAAGEGHAATGTSAIVRAAENLTHLVEVTRAHVTRFRLDDRDAAVALVAVSTVSSPTAPTSARRVLASR